MENSNIQLTDLENFAEKHGKKNLKAILKTLGHGTIFIQVMETEVGKEILKESVDRLLELFERIAEDPFCDDKLKIEYIYLKKLCFRWSIKIMNFYKAKKALKP